MSVSRPRRLEDREVALAARKILGQLREEISKSVRAEYRDEQDE